MASFQSRRERGSAFLPAFAILLLTLAASLSYVTSAAQRVHQTSRLMFDAQGTQLCEAGVQAVLLNLWLPFNTSQSFTNLDTTCTGASTASPVASTGDIVSGNMRYSAGIIGYTQPTGDTYTRILTIRSVGWVDLNGNGTLDANEPQKVVDVSVTFTLARSQVFDYSYFVNNFGWMDGFGPNDLVVNGDMRANGNFNITNGSPTVNGSLYATLNQKLSPASAGLVNVPPVKWTNSQYSSNLGGFGSGSSDNEARWRPVYNSTADGAYGSSQYNQVSGQLFDANGQIINNSATGSVVADSSGVESWTRSDPYGTASTTKLDTTPTSEVIMPDLAGVGSAGDSPDANGSYVAQSKAYVDTMATYSDGTANPNYNKGAFIQTWNPSANSGVGAYQTISTSGVINGSAVVVGTNDHPVLIHGPVTATQDILIKGTISGQGTIYTGRNIHIVGSIVYKTKPDFRATDPLGAANQKADMLGLAASGSIIMGDTTQFGYYPLAYMMPPFTNGRYDQYGNWIPPFDATQVDSTGFMKYQTVMGASTMSSVAEGINQIDAVLYTNFVGGGNIGTSGNGITLNGSIISRDEAMVVWSLPMHMNYDLRIKERSLTQTPLIDLHLPRSPVLTRSAWLDRGFYAN